MKSHTFGWLIFLALIKSFSCDPNPFKLKDTYLTAKEGSCVEIKCKVSAKVILGQAYWFWMKDAIWIENIYNATIIYSTSEEKRPVSPHFVNRVTYVGSPAAKWISASSSSLETCSILICNLNKTDSGNYSFRFLGEKKWVTNPFTNLTVTENPCLLTFEKPEKVTENETVTLTCSTLSSCHSAPKIEALTSAAPSKFQTNSENKRTTLSFTATWEDDGSMFSCQTKDNTDAYFIRNITLTVEYAPKDISAKISPENVVEGQTVSLTCSAKGNPTPSLTWFKNTTLQSSEANWTIPSVTDSHSGSYYCKAQNTRGSKESKMIIINVTYAPYVDIQILQEPKRSLANIREGDNVTFHCTVKRSNPPPTSFTWLKDNTAFTWKQTFVVESIKPEDSRTYTCRAQNTVGPGSSNSLDLKVQYKPRNTRISNYDAHVKKVKITTSLRFTCETDAYPLDLSYSWYRYSQTDPSRKTFVDSKNTLDLVNVQRADEACYICNASNIIDRGDTSKPMCIEVLFPPNRTMLYMDTEVTEGQQITVSCSAESYPKSSFNLRRSSASNSRTPEWTFALSTARYTFNVTSAHAGFYTCDASNSEGHQRSPEMKLLVKHTPKEVKIEARPNLDVKENESLTLDCSAKSYPPVITVTWMKMTSGNKESTESTQRTLSIKSASVSDSGLYRCIAKNKIGTGKSQQVEVKVKYGPKHTKIVKEQEEKNPDGTYSVRLKCISQCYPPVKQYSWYKRIDNKKMGEFQSNYQTITVNSQKSGEYYCITKNEIGEGSSEPIKPFDDTVAKIVKIFLFCLFLLILFIIFFLYRRRRNKLIQQGTTITSRQSDFLAWWNGVRGSSGTQTSLAEPFRNRDDLLPDQPCHPNPQQRQPHPDSTSASNINTVYSIVNLPKGKQAASAQKPVKQHGGHKENDSLNYASLNFVNKQKYPEEDAEYSVVSKPKKSKEKEKERQEDYENISTLQAPKPPYTYDFDTDTDTSEDEVEVNYTQVNFKPKSGHQRAKRDSSSSSSTEDETQYSEVKI